MSTLRLSNRTGLSLEHRVICETGSVSRDKRRRWIRAIARRPQGAPQRTPDQDAHRRLREGESVCVDRSPETFRRYGCGCAPRRRTRLPSSRRDLFRRQFACSVTPGTWDAGLRRYVADAYTGRMRYAKRSGEENEPVQSCRPTSARALSNQPPRLRCVTNKPKPEP